MLLSIVIPTLNEEKYLPRLLEVIKKQSFRDWEIIVADAGSKDKTVNLAKAAGCQVVKGGRPAKGRNEGVKKAKGDLILFLDADVVLPRACLNKAVREFQKRGLGVAAFPLAPYTKKKLPKFLFDFFFNYPLKLLEERWPHGVGAGIFIKKALHQKIGGWDESIKIAEDHDYVQRATKHGKFGAIKSTYIYFDMRRFEKEGLAKVLLKYILTELHMKVKGPVKKGLFEYEFGHFGKNKDS